MNRSSISRIRRVAFTLFAAVVATQPAAAQPTAVNDATIVNQTTTGRQLNGAFAALGEGNLVVVWEGEDADGRGVFGRVVDPSGQPVGDEFPVSVTEDGDQVEAEVVSAPDGAFLVVWENDLSGGSGIASRFFDANGTPSAEVDVAADDPERDVSAPAINRLEDGTFVVVWDDYESAENDGSIRARYLDATGNVMGAAFVLPTDGLSSNVFAPELADRPNGGFLVSWDYIGAPNGRWGQAFTDAAGVDSVPLEITPGSSNDNRMAGLDDGGFVTVWRSSLNRAMRRRFDDMGVAASEVEVAPTIAGLQRATDVTALPGAAAAITWTTAPNTDPDRIDVQIVDAADAAEDTWQVTTSNVSLFGSRILYDPATAHVVVLWTERFATGGDQDDVLIRRYDAGLASIFADGFESGNTSAWGS